MVCSVDLPAAVWQFHDKRGKENPSLWVFSPSYRAQVSSTSKHEDFIFQMPLKNISFRQWKWSPHEFLFVFFSGICAVSKNNAGQIFPWLVLNSVISWCVYSPLRRETKKYWFVGQGIICINTEFQETNISTLL